MISKTYNRLRRLTMATRYEISGLLEDIKLLGRLGNCPCSFRHSRLNGFRLLVRADEDLGRDVFFFREYEPREIAYVLRNLRDSDICLDVGANVGVYTLSLAAKASEGSVHAFEPAALNWHVLEVNVLANRLSNVILNNCAIGDRNVDVEFYVAQDGGFSSTLDTGRKAIVAKTQVRMITVDSYCYQASLPRVDFLKVDVEGGEPGVIRGAHELLSDSKRKPRLIMLELYEPMLLKFGAGIRDVVSLMKGYGYAPSICVDDDLVAFNERHYNTFFNVFFTKA
jgi:FkbM family methyltransferase